MVNPNSFPGDITIDVDDNGDVLVSQDPQMDYIPQRLAQWELEQDHPQTPEDVADTLFNQAVLRGIQRANSYLKDPDTVGAEWPSIAITKGDPTKKPLSRNKLSNKGKLMADREPDTEHDPAYKEPVMLSQEVKDTGRSQIENIRADIKSRKNDT